MPRLSKIGAAAAAAFGITGTPSIPASYLVVAGGGSGGYQFGGGGGAGGYQTGTVSLWPSNSYTVVVGAGGAAPSTSGIIGSNSVLSGTGITTVTSLGGGGGGSYNGTTTGTTGGSGGGGSYYLGAGGSGTGGQGNSGGANSSTNGVGGGGGGAGAAGSTATGNAGAGGIGLASSITGTSTYYAGGGGGGGNFGSVAAGGNGGGGAGGVNGPGSNGTANTGGGGGGNNGNTSGAGGSGVVIISYAGSQQFGGGVVTSVGGNTIHTFNSSGTLTPLSSLTASYLIVAGGGGGANESGGGGAGGMQTGSGLVIDTNSTYVVTVGAGGAPSASASLQGSSGANSIFSAYKTASVGGGGGGNGANVNSNAIGLSGGSGGGGGGWSATSTPAVGGSGTAGQGNSGGTGSTDNITYTTGAGGGGAGASGSNATSSGGGNGGAGLSSSISGTATYYAGGGGGGADVNTLSFGTGGIGGGGNGGRGNSAAVAGTVNTGGGGGGAYPYTNAAAGGSGIVIISYAGSTQLMAGGSVTITGGNVIHTFTSSGYLTPLTYFNNSLRFRSGGPAYLTRTPTVASNTTTWTWSGWIKLSVNTSLVNWLFAAGTNGTNDTGIYINTDSTLQFYNRASSTINGYIYTAAVFRDPAAWYHIVATYDANNATATDRMRLYVNGVRQTVTVSTQLSSGTNSIVDTAVAHQIGTTSNTSSPNRFDGYMTNINFIDGQALTPNAFGSFNSYGVWQPITYGGSYGTNGFFLPFTNKTSTTTLGYDFGPAGNNWTPNNISLTAGSTYDSMTDVPTLTSATAANYPIQSPLYPGSSTITNGNLQSATASATVVCSASSFQVSNGKWYWEVTATTVQTGNFYPFIGAYRGIPASLTGSARPGGDVNGFSLRQNGNFLVDTTNPQNVSSFTNGDVIGIALDLTSLQVQYYKNGSLILTQTGLVAGTYTPADAEYSGSTVNYNYGQQPFAYTPPSGFVALNTYNM